MEINLKPCPFCGADAYLMDTLETVEAGDPLVAWVACSGCGAEGSKRYLPDYAEAFVRDFQDTDEETPEDRDMIQAELKKARSHVSEAWNQRMAPNAGSPGSF